MEESVERPNQDQEQGQTQSESLIQAEVPPNENTHPIEGEVEEEALAGVDDAQDHQPLPIRLTPQRLKQIISYFACVYLLAGMDTLAYSIVNNSQLLTLLESWDLIDPDLTTLTWYEWLPTATLTLLAGIGAYALTVSVNKRASRKKHSEESDQPIMIREGCNLQTENLQENAGCFCHWQSVKKRCGNDLPQMSLAGLGGAGEVAILLNSLGGIINKFGIVFSQWYVFIPALLLSGFTGAQFTKQHWFSLKQVTQQGWGMSPPVVARLRRTIPNRRLRYSVIALLYSMAVLYATTGGIFSAGETYAIFQLLVRMAEGATEDSYDLVANRIAWTPTLIFGIAYAVCVYSSLGLRYLDYLGNKVCELVEKGLRQFARDNFVASKHHWRLKLLAGIIGSAILLSNGQISYTAWLEISYIVMHNGPPPQPTNHNRPLNANCWAPWQWQLGLFTLPTLNEMLASHATESAEAFEMLGLNDIGYELVLRYDRRPADDEVAHHKLYLFRVHGVENEDTFAYRARNAKGKLCESSITAEDLPQEVFEKIQAVLKDLYRQAVLDDPTEMALFAFMAKLGFRRLEKEAENNLAPPTTGRLPELETVESHEDDFYAVLAHAIGRQSEALQAEIKNYIDQHPKELGINLQRADNETEQESIVRRAQEKAIVAFIKITGRPLILLQDDKYVAIPWDIERYYAARHDNNAVLPIFLFHTAANGYEEHVLLTQDNNDQENKKKFWKILKSLMKEQQEYNRYLRASGYNAKRFMIDALHFLVLSGAKIGVEWVVVPPTAKPRDITLGENIGAAVIVGIVAVLFSILPRNIKRLRQGAPTHRPLLLQSRKTPFKPPLSMKGWLWRWVVLFFLASILVLLSQKAVRLLWLGDIKDEDQAVLDNAQIFSSAVAGVVGVWHHHTFFSGNPEEGCLVRRVKQMSKSMWRAANGASIWCSGFCSRRGGNEEARPLDPREENIPHYDGRE